MFNHLKNSFVNSFNKIPNNLRKHIRYLTFKWIPTIDCLNRNSDTRHHKQSKNQWFVDAQRNRIRNMIHNSNFGIISPYAPVALYNPINNEISISPAFVDEFVLKFYNTSNKLQTYAGIGFVIAHELAHSILYYYLINLSNEYEKTLNCFKQWNFQLFRHMNSSQLLETMADLHGMRILIEFLKRTDNFQVINWNDFFFYFALPWCDFRSSDNLPDNNHAPDSIRLQIVIQYFYEIQHFIDIKIESNIQTIKNRSTEHCLLF